MVRRRFRFDMNRYSGKQKPFDQMEELGFRVSRAEPWPIADCWMMSCAYAPTTWPEYIEELDAQGW